MEHRLALDPSVPTPLPLSPLLPDLSDLESAFLHFTFLPVRREIDRTRREDIRVWSRASRGTLRLGPDRRWPSLRVLDSRRGTHLLMMMRMPSRNNMVARVMPTVCTVS